MLSLRIRYFMYEAPWSEASDVGPDSNVHVDPGGMVPVVTDVVRRTRGYGQADSDTIGFWPDKQMYSLYPL